MKTRGLKKELIGMVVSNKMNKTVVVVVSKRVAHPMYKKTFTKKTKYSAHDEKNVCKSGDTVRMIQTRPISKTKSWKVVEVLKKAALSENIEKDFDLKEVIK